MAVITYKAIEAFFKALKDENVLKKAENAFDRGRVISINYDGNFKYASGKVKASH